MNSLKKASRTKSLSLSDDSPSRLSPISSQQQQQQQFAQHQLPQQQLLAGRGIGQRPRRVEDATKIFKYIDDNVIGKGVAFLGPFGRRKVVYADYSSSGRSLQFLEDYINKEVLPAYGDINCTSSVTGLQSQLYYKEAKDLIRTAVNASADDEIVFCEAAYTSPVERIAYILCLKEASSQQAADGSSPGCPILFCSTSEPDHNIRPWLDLGVQIERIAKTHEGYLDLDDLEKRLTTYVGTRRRLIGLFSGASRLTGILADDVATTILLHQYGALSIWDYSPAAPCTMVDTNPVLPGAAKDAVFFCANKFVGGVQAPGVLILKKVLLTHSNQKIYDSVGIVGAVRAGLVIQLKESLGTQAIMTRHEKLCKQLLAHIRTIPEIILLGSVCETVKRLPTVCFMVRHSRGTYLHHRFVVAVLNDVFGIQATAHNTIVEAMSISPQLAVQYERLRWRRADPDGSGAAESRPANTCLAPGYTQITLPFFMADSEVGFVLEALKMVATEAWKLLPQYECDEATAEWRHQSNVLLKERKLLGTIRYTDGRMLFNDRRISGPGLFPQNYADCLQTARNLFNRARKMSQRTASSVAVDGSRDKVASQRTVLRMSGAQAEALRWYMLPGEAHELLLGHSQNVKHVVPFDPNKSLEPPSLLNLYHRHYSLPALDTRRFKSQSLPTSPVHRQVTRQQSSPSPTRQLLTRQQSPILERREPPATPTRTASILPATTTPPNTPTSTIAPPQFSVGGEVTTGLRTPPSPSTEELLVDANEAEHAGHDVGEVVEEENDEDDVDEEEDEEVVDAPQKRNRCHTWSSSAPATGSLLLLSPQTRLSLGLRMPQRNIAVPRKRLCSCSSQTDVEESLQDASGNGNDGLSMGASAAAVRSFSNSNASINQNSDSEDIETYVKSITEGIADNLKSEIREVISRVEDVLDHADSTAEANLSSLQMQLSLQHISSAEDLRLQQSPSDSVSASDVAEYLKEFSKGITSQVKSEIREVTNAMNDHDQNGTAAASALMQQQSASSQSAGLVDVRRFSPPDIFEQPAFGIPAAVKDKIQLHRYSDTPAICRPSQLLQLGPISELADKQRSDSFPPACPSSAPAKCSSLRPTHSSAPCPELSTPSCPYTGAISKHLSVVETALSLSSTMSQDSGINMSFSESTTYAATERCAGGAAGGGHSEADGACGGGDSTEEEERSLMLRSLSTQTACSELTDDDAGSGSRSSSTASSRQTSHHVLLRQPKVTAQSEAHFGAADVARLGDSIYQARPEASAAVPNQWQYLPQSVWKQTAETIDEFGMLQDGDRVLVCLSGSSASLSLLHALRQFTRARHLQRVELAAVTLGSAGGVDPRALMLYLRDLGVRLHCEPLAPTESLRAKLQLVARQHGYTVLALANTVDKLADDFLQSVLRHGRLAAMQAHCRNRDGDLRIVRPFLCGVRERQLEDVAVQYAWPTRASRRLCRPPDAATSVMRVQETVNPGVYKSIVEAVRPLLAMRTQEDLEEGDFRQCFRAR